MKMPDTVTGNRVYVDWSGDTSGYNNGKTIYVDDVSEIFLASFLAAFSAVLRISYKNFFGFKI